MKKILGSLVLLTSLIPGITHALGTRIADQDPTATARGNAFAATADNPSAIYYNPAGITQLAGQQFSIGAYSISLRSEFTSPTGAKFDTEDEILFVPQLYYTISPTNIPLSFGVGVYSPFGLGLEWPDNTPFRTLAKDGRITYLTLNPVVAWKITPNLSIAAGPTINYSEATLTRGAAFPGDNYKFKGDDTAVGFNVGLLWKLHEQHSIGINYRSATTLDYSGDVSYTYAPFNINATGAGNAQFDFPQNIVVGYSYRPTTNWNFEVNIDWTDWNSLNTVTLNTTPGLGGAVPLVFNWESSFFYEFGVTHQFENGWSISGGYIFSENSVPETTFSPAVPDSNRHIFSVGGGRQYEKWSWYAAYQLALGPERDINNPAFYPNAPANGSYQFISHALTFNVGYRF
ncbi:MAG: outer membrane protein transport protein [Opitutaceae bacterium]|nr:outer membrane protein transport protein [Verrucomicrobiales bacterium]